MARKITMQDIANELNISKNSVSQALSGKPGVSEITRDKIQQKANELGYYYSKGKPSTSPIHTSGNIALIASDFVFSLSFFGEIYLTIEQELNKRGMNLLIQSINEQQKNNFYTAPFIEQGDVDGLLILSHISTDYINHLLTFNLPTVLIDHHDPFNMTDSVLINNRFAAHNAVHHLIELGHKRIGFLGDVDRSPSYQERFEGYLLALKHGHISPTTDWLLTNVDEASEAISKSVDTLNEQPTAWFCINDGFGFLLLTHLQTKQKRIPEDVSICSFDNGQLSRMANPKMTTMDINLKNYAKKAVDQLFWRIAHPDEPFQEVLLHSELLVRASTGKASQ
ncbi:LacI family DNA-binding transcriptional regulator [Alkalicoccobacillus porphyridii]|uniref:LacI family transcriptional regulator n=1 Tax=Alkalicoccobacillus porphyridii TaxID=2597270 RepID=A0A553ZUI0_9BACI|nr:LacI family DNA-binding transcriptional regulator [Alkalicoccobacillus porphyridii]TSB45109.1 LacI family transcriptional regulator [Alkalicoccobacillus porphyridii]